MSPVTEGLFPGSSQLKLDATSQQWKAMGTWSLVGKPHLLPFSTTEGLACNSSVVRAFMPIHAEKKTKNCGALTSASCPTQKYIDIHVELKPLKILDERLNASGQAPVLQERGGGGG